MHLIHKADLNDEKPYYDETRHHLENQEDGIF